MLHIMRSVKQINKGVRDINNIFLLPKILKIDIVILKTVLANNNCNRKIKKLKLLFFATFLYYFTYFRPYLWAMPIDNIYFCPYIAWINSFFHTYIVNLNIICVNNQMHYIHVILKHVVNVFWLLCDIECNSQR